MNIAKTRILGSGFTRREYSLYGFENLGNPQLAMRYLSFEENHRRYHPCINIGYEKHLLDDKWMTHQVLSALAVPVPRTLGLYHPVVGLTASGDPLRNPEDLCALLRTSDVAELIFKPRGGSRGDRITKATIQRRADGMDDVQYDGRTVPVAEFPACLAEDVFDVHTNRYPGWIIQEVLRQHPFLAALNPSSVNTFRIVTFMDTEGNVHIHHSILRVGCGDNATDNWDKGGLSIRVDPSTGQLGKGVRKAEFGGEWSASHPETGAPFEGLQIPEWNAILELCEHAARIFSGARSIGWDIALTVDGPVIVEANADWGLPSVQVHGDGYLSDAIRDQLRAYGAAFPTRLRSLPLAVLHLVRRRWGRSRGPRLLSSLRRSLSRGRGRA